MKKTGQILRENREKLGLTIHEISLALKINSRIIKAMEEGNSAQLPPRTFLRGFVQSYATYLKLNTEEFMETFQAEIDPPKVETPEAEPTPVSTKPAEKTSIWPSAFFRNGSSKTASVAIGAVAILAVISVMVISRTIDKYQQESTVVPPEEVHSLETKKTETEEALTEAPAEAKTEAPERTAAASAEHSSKSMIPVPVSSLPKSDDAPAAAPEHPPAKVVQVIQPDAPKVHEPKAEAKVEGKPEVKPAEVKVAALAKPEAKPEVKPEVAPEAKSETKPEVAETGTPQELILEALDKVSIEVQIDGAAPQTFNLAAEQIRTIKAKKNLKVKLSDGGAVSLIYNGKDSGVPGDLGKPLSLTFPK